MGHKTGSDDCRTRTSGGEFFVYAFLQEYPTSWLTLFVLDCFREQEKERQRERLPNES